jgi:hypothetical protein
MAIAPMRHCRYENIYSPSQKQIPNTSRRKVKRGAGPKSLQNLKIDQIEIGPNELLLGGRNVGPQLVVGFDHLEPFGLGRVAVLGQTVVEEDADGGFFTGFVVRV